MTSSELAQFAIDSKAESERFNKLTPQERECELTQQIDSYQREVLRDDPVSIPYNYWFGKDGCLYTNPSREPIYNAENQFDQRERGGLPLEGFRRVTKRLAHSPNNIVLWYSPKGLAAFDNDPENPYGKINDGNGYTDGQFYIQYYDSFQKKINAVAVKATNENILKQFMPDVFAMAERKGNEKGRISTLLENPVTFFGSVDEFLDRSWADGEIYRDKFGVSHNLSDVLQGVRNALSGIKSSSVELSPEIRAMLQQEKVTPEMIRQAYLTTIYYYMKGRGDDTMMLSGGCGGNTISLQNLEQMLGIQNLQPYEIMGVHSSLYRLLQENKLYYDDYECPHCHETLSGERIGQQASWRKACEKCSGAIRCA
jgi:hypothetical protein